MRPPIRKAVIPAAGLGTRFLPATKAIPKEMLPIVDRPIIEYVVEEAAASGIHQVIVVTGQSKRSIEDHFDRHFELEARLEALGRLEELEKVRQLSRLADFVYVRQSEPRGNGHAVLCARSVVGDEPFAMIWGDDIVNASPTCLQQMIEAYDRHGGAVAAVMRVRDEDVSRYGVIDPEVVAERLYRVRGIIEKPPREAAPSNLAAVHAWILPSRIFSLLEATPAGKDGEIWLADAIEMLLREEPVHAVEFEGRRYDAGDKLEFLQANIEYALRRPDLGPPLRQYLETLLS